MSALEREVESILTQLAESGVLQHLMVIGSWVMLFYKDIFKAVDYHPVVHTTDIDFLIPKLPPKTVNVDVPALMGGLGFHRDYSSDGWLTFHKPELHVEFLWPRVGPKSDVPIKIKELAINARPLRHMWLLRDYQIKVLYKGMTLTVPHPLAYAFHKLIIADRRIKPVKQAKDRAQAEEVLLAFRDTGDRKMIHEFFAKLSKKEKKSVETALAKMPLLDGLLLVANPHL